MIRPRESGRATSAEWSLPVGRVIALIGGLALVAAFFMPWFETRGVILTGQFLAQFLGNTNDLRQFLPGSAGGPGEVQALRALVFFFPVSGGLAAIVALIGGGRRAAIDIVLIAIGLIVTAALLGGIARLPAGANAQVGLWLIGGGAPAIAIGAAIDLLIARRRPPAALPDAEFGPTRRP